MKRKIKIIVDIDVLNSKSAANRHDYSSLNNIIIKEKFENSKWHSFFKLRNGKW